MDITPSARRLAHSILKGLGLEDQEKPVPPANPQNYDVNGVGAVGSSTDILARQQLEIQKYQKYQVTPDTVWIGPPDTRPQEPPAAMVTPQPPTDVPPAGGDEVDRSHSAAGTANSLKIPKPTGP